VNNWISGKRGGIEVSFDSNEEKQKIGARRKGWFNGRRRPEVTGAEEVRSPKRVFDRGVLQS